MNRNLTVICALSFALTVASAYAGDARSADSKGNPIQIQKAAAQTISWEEFQAHCQNPAQFNAQTAPQNIQLECTNVETQYVAQAPGQLPTKSTRKVQALVTSSKWNVGDQLTMKEYPSSAGSASCLRFKEVEKTLKIARQLTCNDVLSIKGSVEDYCAGALEASRSMNPKAIQIKETGKVIDTCASLMTASEPTEPGAAPANPAPAEEHAAPTMGEHAGMTAGEHLGKPMGLGKGF